MTQELIRVSQLNELKQIDPTDWFVVLDSLDKTQSPQGSTKKIQSSNLNPVIFVTPTGNNDDVIIQAIFEKIKVIGSGTVCFKDGIYDIKQKLHPYGKTTIKCENKWQAILKSAANVNDTLIENTVDSDIHIEGIAIDMNASQNTTLNSKHGINLAHGSNCSVERVKVSNIRHAQGQENVAIGMAYMSTSQIKNCYIDTVGDYGIASNGLLYCEIKDNYILNPAGHGIGLQYGSIGSPNERPIGCTVTGNVIHYDTNETFNTQDGIKFGKIDQCTITNNRIICENKNGYAGIHSAEINVGSSDDTDFERGNVIALNTITGFRFGINVVGSLGDSVSVNTITLPDMPTLGPTGIECSLSLQVGSQTISSGVQISGNTITYETNTVLNAGGGGIVIIGGSSFINITGNTITNASYAGILLYEDCHNNNISGNIIKDSMKSAIYIGLLGADGCNNNNISGNILSGGSRAGNGLYSEIELHGACLNTKIHGNSILTPNVNVIKYGIDEVDSTVDFSQISDNYVKSTATAGVNVHTQGSSSIVLDYKTGGSGFYGLSSASGGGAIFILNSTGGTNPKKFLRSRAGAFEIIDSAFTNRLIAILDSGRIGGYNISAPTAWLHLPAGLATPSGAPFKLTSGVTLTTPEGGVFEYTGTNLYFTTADGVRHTLI